MTAQKKWYYFVWLCFIIEAGSLTFLRGIAGKYMSPVLFVAGVIAGIYGAIKLIRSSSSPELNAKPKRVFTFSVYAIGFGLLMFLTWLWLRSFYDSYPLDPSYSDIIPMIRKINERFVHGQQVYTTVNDFGYTAYPTYLPATWMPFLIADKLQLDYRTWAYIMLCGNLLLCAWLLPTKNSRKIYLLLFPFGVFLYYVWSQPSAFGWTVEPMIAGFYILLVMGIYLRNVWIMGLALILCLLSRYAIIVWIPALFILLFFFENKKRTLLTAGISLAGILAIFVFPFLLSQPDLLQTGHSFYTPAALAEWDGQSWQQPGELPFQLSQKYGFAIFFYKWGKGELAEKLKLLQTTHLVICVLVPVLSIVWYWLKGKKWIELNWFLILSLKLYLVLFFAFIQVPYSYLFFTPLLVSAFVMGLLVSRKDAKGR